MINDLICGACSGVAQSLIGHPLDTYKVLIQSNTKNMYINPWRGIQYPMMTSIINCALTFSIHEELKNHNVPEYIRGFISGACISPIVYVSDNYKLNEQIGKKQNINFTSIMSNKGKITVLMRESIAFSVYFYTYEKTKKYTNNSLLSGGIAGLGNWTITYPIDVIRNRQISNRINITQAIKMGSLWNGYLFCAFRAIKVNALGFYVFEMCKSLVV